MLRDAIFDDFWSIFGSIFEVFRGCIARATRLAARRAEPLFLLAGAVLSRVRRLCRKTKNRRRSTKNRSDDASRTRRARKTRFFRSRTRLGVDFGRLSALPSAPGRPFWRPGAPLATLRALPRRAGDAPGRSEMLPRRLRDALGRHGVSGEGPRSNFESILGAPRRLRGSIFDRFSR